MSTRGPRRTAVWGGCGSLWRWTLASKGRDMVVVFTDLSLACILPELSLFLDQLAEM